MKYNFETVLSLVVSIEAGRLKYNLALYQRTGKNEADYRREVRERLMTLNSKKLPDIKTDLIEGIILPQDFATKDVRDFEPDEVKQQIEKNKQFYMQSL